MKQKALFLRAVTFIPLALGLAGCAGGRPTIAGQQCPRNYAPIAMNAPGQTKLQLESTPLPDGEYVMVRTALHFHGDPTPKTPEGFQVVVKEDVPRGAKANTMAVRADCFRNANVDRTYAATVPTLTGLVVKNGEVVESSAKDFGFTMDDEGQFSVNHAVNQRKAQKPHELFRHAHETFALRWTDVDYEIRTDGRAHNGAYAMSTYLHRIR